MSYHYQRDMRRYLFLSILIVQSTLLAAQVSPCIQADSLMAANDFNKAATFYLSCYEQDTFDKKPLASLAFCYFQMGDYALAKPTYHAIENDSSYSKEAIAKLAFIYESQQNIPKAIKYYISLNNIYVDHPTYLRKLGSLYLQGGIIQEAIQTYRKCYGINPRDMITTQALTEIYFNLEEFNIADSISSAGKAIDSTNVGLLLLSARIKYRLRDYNAAAKTLYRLSFETDLNNYYHKILGYSLMQIDSLDKAIHYLQKSLVNENNPEYSLYYLALAYERKLEFEKSLWFYEEAAKAGISTNMSQYHKGPARIHTHQKQYQKAINQYQKSLEYQKDPEVFFYMANAAEQVSKKKSTAITYYQKYLDSGHQNKEWVKLSTERIKTLKEHQFMSQK